jgi:hypothetical protein
MSDDFDRHIDFDPESGKTDGVVSKSGHTTQRKANTMAGFSFTPASGTSTGAQSTMRAKISMKAPKGQPAGKSLAARSGRMKGLVVKGSAKLKG